MLHDAALLQPEDVDDGRAALAGHAHTVDVPDDDVALVGFEDSVIARQTEPALTTVHQPVEAMGATMARLLVAHIRGEQQPARLVILDTHLVVRASA